MTVKEVENISITNPPPLNPIKTILMNHEPIDDRLHVVIVLTNPCQYRTRIRLLQEFKMRFEVEEDSAQVILYIVEVVYGDSPFTVTHTDNPRHYQIRFRQEEPWLWLRENLVNVAVRHLLPSDWKAMAWIDADVAFENLYWATECLQLLNNHYDVVQLFSHCVEMDKDERTLRVHTSLGYVHVKGIAQRGNTGYAWACNRNAYEQMGGLYEWGIVGSGDNIMALSFVQSSVQPISTLSHPEYLQSVADFKRRVRGFRVGYVPGVIRHYYHGAHSHLRTLVERWKILVRGEYRPSVHVWSDEEKGGVIRATPVFPTTMALEIKEYFMSRKEDD